MQNLQSARIAITGANGFIGSHLLKRLLSIGCDAWAVVPTGECVDRLELLLPAERIRRFSGAAALGEAVFVLQPDVVFHLGALIRNHRTLEAFHDTLEWNLLSTLGLYESLTRSRLTRLVQIGSCEEYGRQPTPFKEVLAPDPASPYSASKAAISSYARMFYNCFDLPVTVLRPSVVYGPWQSPSMLIPEVITALLAGREVATTEGRQTRDFLYVDDLVEAAMRSTQAAETVGAALNLGSGETVTVRSCVEMIEDLIGRTGLVRFGARPYNSYEIWDYTPDTTLARNLLQWEPRTSLRDGLKLTIAAFGAEQLEATLRKKDLA